LLSTRVEGDRIVPHYLTERDEPWLRALLDEHARFVGRRRSELRERLREPLPVRAPVAKLRVAGHVLDAIGRGKTSACIPPRDARWFVFRAASKARAPRDEVLRTAAASLDVAAEELDSALFADLRGEQRVIKLPNDLSASRLALLANQAIVTSLLRRAAHVRIRAWGNTRALVRHVRLLGLICVVSRPLAETTAVRLVPPGLDAERGEPLEGVVLEISGPFALFRRTEVYGRALASVLPRAAWCNDYEIDAACALDRGGHLSTLLVRSGDPIPRGRELNRYDSKVEQRFARDFARAAPDWDLIREPRPVAVEGTLVFPDFELVHRRDRNRRWLLEIVGFWTREYLVEKLRRLRAARLPRFVFCIDERRLCGDAQLAAGARYVVRYKSRIDPMDVLALVDRDETR
jgi:predicted nuclease of restriction endonuclease-like RecB superfamily